MDLIKSKFISNAILLVFGIILIYLPVSSFIENKVTLSRIFSDILLHTIAEVFIYALLSFILYKFIPKYKLIVASIPVVIYCRNHSILIPLICVIAFYFQILLLGKFLYDSFKVKLKLFDSKYPIWIGLGFLIWPLIVLIFHLIPFQNDIVALRILAASLLCILVYFNRSFIREISLKHYENIEYYGIKSIVIFITLFSFFALCAKSNACLSFDSIWYGMRSEYVLLGEHTIYDNLGYTGFVHYYPKLWEIINLPFSGLDYSFLYVSTTVCFGIFMLIVLYYLSQIDKESTLFNNFLVVASVFSIPAIVNLATSAKPDIFCSFMFVFSILALVDLRNTDKERQFNLILFSLMCFSMSCITKFSAWGYAPFYIIYFLYQIFNIRPKLRFSFSSIPYIFCLLLIILVLLRNVLITGMPAPLFTSIWESLGFAWKYPFIGRVDPMVHHSFDLNIPNHLKKLYTYIFRPGDFSTAFWVGNSLIFLMLFVFSKKQMLKSVLFWISLLAFILIFIRPNIREYQDGNYFIIPLVLILVAGATKLKKLNAIGIILILFITSFQFILNFSLNSSWKVGVKKFDFSLVNPVNTDQSQLPLTKDLIKINKIFTEFEQKNGKAPRVIDATGLDRRLTRRLDARLETIKTLCSPYLGSRSVCINDKNFLEYLKWINADFLFINKNKYDKLGIANGEYTFIDLLRYTNTSKDHSFKNTKLISLEDIKNNKNIIQDLTANYNKFKKKFIINNPKLIANLKKKTSAKNFVATPVNPSKVKLNFSQNSKNKTIHFVKKPYFKASVNYFINKKKKHFVIPEFWDAAKFRVEKIYTINDSPVYQSKDNKFTMMVKNNSELIIVNNNLKIDKTKQKKYNDQIFNIVNQSPLKF